MTRDDVIKAAIPALIASLNYRGDALARKCMGGSSTQVLAAVIELADTFAAYVKEPAK